MKALLCALLLILSSCATLNENQCRVGDWEAYGRVDGEKGNPAAYELDHESACRKFGVQVDHETYQRARREGLKSYCTPESGYRAGRANAPYYGVCEGTAAAAFKAQYAIGLGFNRAEASKRDVEQELANTPPEPSVIVDVLGLSPVSRRRHELLTRRDALDDEMRHIDSLAPAPNLELRYSPTALGDGMGALTGTFFGFGSGHAIQGRYLESGWLFTLSEVATIAALAAAPTACGGANTCRAFAVGIPLLAFLGAKIWESFDVWHFFIARNYGYPHFQ